MHFKAQNKKKEGKIDSLTTEQKLSISKVGSLYEYEKKERSKMLGINMVLQSKVKLKSKQKSKV
jgi:hypothetical protein